MDLIQTSALQEINQIKLDDAFWQMVGVILSMLVIVFGIFKWFVGRLDQGEKKKDEYLKSIKDAIVELKNNVQELKVITSVHEVEIEHLKDKVFPVRYPKKDKEK